MADTVAEEELSEAVEFFWRERLSRGEERAELEIAQGGKRAEVTSGGHMSGFEEIMVDRLMGIGVPESSIYTGKQAVLPGYFRPSKNWDLVVLQEDTVVAAIELKSQTASFGNNWNNRAEEAVGSGFDFRTAMDHGVMESPVRPWLGFVYLMEEAGMKKGGSLSQPLIEMADVFANATYADRCEELCLRLLDTGVYDGASFLLSKEENGLEGDFWMPHERLKFQHFTESLVEHVEEFLEEHGQRQQGLDGFTE